MANPTPVFYEADDTTLAAVMNFGNLIPGTPSAEHELHLKNTAGDDMTSVFISVLTRFPGDTSFTAENVVAAMRMVEVRAEGVVGSGIEDQTTSLTPVGKGRWLPLLKIPAGTARKLFFKVLLAPGVGNGSVEVKVICRYAGPSIALEMGHFESGAQGVLTGAGDGSMTEILSGGVATASGSPDEFVTLTDIVGIHQGEKYATLEHQEEFDDEDSAAATLASGESYWGVLSVGAGGAVTQTKSVKGTTPLDPSTAPAVPDGARFVARVEVKFGLAIATGDINQDALLYGFHAFSFAALAATIHPGVALIDNFLVHDQTTNIVNLTDNATNVVWRNGSGTFAALTDGSRPTERALPLFEATTVSGAVTAWRDLRPWIGPRLHALAFDFLATLAANQYAYAIYPHGCDGSLRLANPINAALDVVGSGTGGTKFDVQYYDEDGSAWVSIFTSSGTVDRRPSMTVVGAVAKSSDAVPEVYRVPGFSRWRAKVVNVPGTTPPDRAVLEIPVEIAA